MKISVNKILVAIIAFAIGAIFFVGSSIYASSITTINGSDQVSASRTTINTNFSNLNTDKLESGSSAPALTIAVMTAGSYTATSTLKSTFPFASSTALTVSGTAFISTITPSNSTTTVNGGVVATAFSAPNATSTLSGIVLNTGCIYFQGACMGAGGGGTVTSVAVTYPLTGGPITSSGTLALAFGTTTANNWSALQTITSASTTNLTISNFFTAPNGTAPTVTIAGQFAVVASTTGSALTYYDTGTQRFLPAQTDVGFTWATTTSVAGTTTIKTPPFSRSTKLTEVSCTSDGGTFVVQLGNGTASTTGVTSTTGLQGTYTTISSNNTFTRGMSALISFGTPSATTITQLSCGWGKTYNM